MKPTKLDLSVKNSERLVQNAANVEREAKRALDRIEKKLATERRKNSMQKDRDKSHLFELLGNKQALMSIIDALKGNLTDLKSL